MPPSIASLDLPAFHQRFPWWGPDLQTIANRLRRPVLDLAPHRSERLRFPLADGTGDTLLAMLDRPAAPKSDRPLIILIHGLTGGEDSIYMRLSARHFLKTGHCVLRLNLRGAGPSRALCGDQYYAGRSRDFRNLLPLLPADLTRHGIVAVGYSLGGAMLLKYLGEEGTATPLVAAATVSSPIDLSLTSRHMLKPRNRIYHGHILTQMKREATGEGAAVSPAERAAILGSRTIWDYDEVFIAPRHGFAGAEDYYERCRPIHFIPGIRIPTLMIAAADDPWIPISAYRDVDWAGNPALLPLLPQAGGHVGFHGTAGDRPWSDIAIGQFIRVALGLP